MAEVDIHGLLLLDFKLFSDLDVVFDEFPLLQLTAINVDLISIHLIIWVVKAQRETKSKTVVNNTGGRLIN